MPTIKKAQSIEGITGHFKTASAVWLVDFRGLNVKQTEQFRREIREVGAEMKVYKNTLATIALRNLGLPEMPELLAGPTGFVIAHDDAAAAAKAIKKFATDSKILVIKGGLMDGLVMSAEQVKAVAELPSREELIAKLLGTIQNPMSQIVRIFNAPAESFARVLGAIADQKDAA
jgi:large subunit ribosomal protein L10